MFGGKSLWVIIQTGGVAMFVLLTCSVLSLAVIFERMIYFRRRSRVKRTDFMQDIRQDLAKNQVSKAVDACRKTDTPFSRVALAGLILSGHQEKAVSEAMEREITIETIKLERYTAIVGTIGSTAVYIGLFGTVLGIIRAFRDISTAGAGGINVVIQGISEALVSTAAGLLVAIPAVITYNFFIRRIDNFVADMELCASELMDLLSIK
ncbi:MAG: MotA/TolQ/ExbB proton channel family protein [Candidatus Omnitrophica bacterium]|nr:MotA/TolQ/ExbB proton channel family protein [Candidatus Omnitrophota bacterium]